MADEGYGNDYDSAIQLITESNSNCPLLHIALLHYINHLIWLVLCTFPTSPDNSENLPNSGQLYISRIKLNLGKRAVSVAAPNIWNELPTPLKSCESCLFP